MSFLQLPSGFDGAYKTPNRKPGGPLAVDRNHPLGKHVIRAFVPTAGAPVDLIHGALIKSGGAAVKAGLGVFPGGANEYFQYRYGLATQLTEFTVVFRARRNSTSVDHGVFSDQASANYGVNGISINYQTVSGRVLFLVNAAQTAANTTSTTTAFSDIACVWKAGEIQKIYQDGIEVAAYTINTIAASHTVSTQPLRIGSYYDASTNRVFDGDISYIYMLDKALTGVQIRNIHLNPYALLKPAVDTVYYFPSAATASAAITGTATASITETDIVSGGKTIIITLTGDTFLAAGTGPIGTTANTQALIDGIDSAQAEATGWDSVVKVGIETADVVRTSDTVATITLDAEASYNITATETITATIPAAVLTGGVAIVGSPTFTITATAAANTLAGSLMMMGVGH